MLSADLHAGQVLAITLASDSSKCGADRLVGGDAALKVSRLKFQGLQLRL